jgi:hypothetical protein
MGWEDKIFVYIIGLIIITILVIEVGKYLDRPVECSPSPPPPKTSLQPVEVEIQEEPTKETSYTSLYSRSSIARTAHLLDGSWSSDYERWKGLEDGDFQEGFGIEDFFKILGDLFKLALNAIFIMVTFPDHILAFAEGFIKLGIGVIHLFEGFITQLMTIFQDTMKLVGDIAKCGMTWMGNLRTCFLWYCLEMFVYVAVILLFWIPIYILRVLTFNRVDLNPLFLRFFGCSDANPYHRMRDIDGRICKQDGFFEKLDQKVHKKLKFHFMHFPDSVCETCYGCNIIGDAGSLFYDSTLGLLEIMIQPIEDVFDAGKLFWHALYLDNWM